MAKESRGVILPVVLVILLLLGVMVGSFSFRTHADFASTQAMSQRLQARLAAQAGIEKVKLLLPLIRLDMDQWYDNPEEFRRIMIWSEDENRSSLGSNEENEGGDVVAAYRFTIVADDPLDDEDFIRFGITDESSKLNLNTAGPQQLSILLSTLFGAEEEIDVPAILDAIIDYRDRDSEPRGEDAGTEGEYYETLSEQPYRVKNAPFDSVEELLLVKGVTGFILYGEDYDRNGLLTENEDDGDLTFPPDNQDGLLKRGLYPYLTVHSYETNVSDSNRPRVYLGSDAATLRAELNRIFEEDFEDDPGGGGEPQSAKVQFIMSMIYPQQNAGNQGGNNNNGDGGDGGDGGNNNDRNLLSARFDRSSADPKRTSSARVQFPGGNQQQGGNQQSATQLPTPAALLNPIETRVTNSVGTEVITRTQSPLTVEDLPLLMDQLTVVSPDVPEIVGLININTAPSQVLRCLPNIEEEDVQAIVGTRIGLSGEQKKSTAWLVSEGVLELDRYQQLAPLITARGQQFMIESIGHADHLGVVSRLEVMVDLVGPMIQTIYYRDLTSLGAPFPIFDPDQEAIRVR